MNCLSHLAGCRIAGPGCGALFSNLLFYGRLMGIPPRTRGSRPRLSFGVRGLAAYAAQAFCWQTTLFGMRFDGCAIWFSQFGGLRGQKCELFRPDGGKIRLSDINRFRATWAYAQGTAVCADGSNRNNSKMDEKPYVFDHRRPIYGIQAMKASKRGTRCSHPGWCRDGCMERV